MAIKIDFGFNDVDRGLDALLKELSALKNRNGYAKAGVLGSSASRDGEKTALSNVDLAMVHEFGTDAVPARSFMRAAFDANQPKYIGRMRTLVQAIYDGKIQVKVALGLIGLEAASDTRNLIRAGSGIPPPNAPATIAAKGSSHTLIDSGQLINAVSHEVVMGGDK